MLALLNGSLNDMQRCYYYFWFHLLLIGLDEGDQESSDPATIQGAYMSYLLLRHLRIRDLQRTVSTQHHYISKIITSLHLFEFFFLEFLFMYP